MLYAVHRGVAIRDGRPAVEPLVEHLLAGDEPVTSTWARGEGPRLELVTVPARERSRGVAPPRARDSGSFGGLRGHSARDSDVCGGTPSGGMRLQDASEAGAASRPGNGNRTCAPTCARRCEHTARKNGRG
jgi:hypothetical protein